MSSRLPGPKCLNCGQSIVPGVVHRAMEEGVCAIAVIK